MRPAERRAGRGRPVATTPEEIERAAFELFADRGFGATTMDDIARTVGVSRRTLFRYFDSKNDIPWGQFDATLDEFRRVLRAMPGDLALHEAVARGVMAFNDVPPHAIASHRTRMRLILTTPELQAHSALRYADWRRVIAEFVAERLGTEPEALLPQMVGHVFLGLALSAYETWLDSTDRAIADVMVEALAAFHRYFGAEPTGLIAGRPPA